MSLTSSNLFIKFFVLLVFGLKLKIKYASTYSKTILVLDYFYIIINVILIYEYI